MKLRLFPWLAVALISLAASAMAAEPKAAGKPAEAAPAVIPPTDSRPNSNAYKLTVGDVIEISVYDEPDLHAPRVKIGADGTATLALLGNVQLAGLTDRQAQAVIEKRLAQDYLVKPQVTLSVVEPTKRTYVVMGQVRIPNVYEIPFGKRIDLIQAIALAGGRTAIGSRKVFLSRTVNGKKEVFTHDVDAMARDRSTPSFEILPNDIIEIKESTF